MMKVLAGMEAWTTKMKPRQKPKLSCTLGGSKVDDLSILLEHVNLLDGRDVLGVDLLQGIGELGLITSSTLGGLLDLPADGSLATNAGLRLELSQLFGINPR
jgi:hypothetical protein